MKNLINIFLIEDKLLIFKKIFNLGIYTQFKILKQLGFSLKKEKLNLNINFLHFNNNIFNIKLYFKILKYLILDIKYFIKMQKLYKYIINETSFLKKTIKFKMGLPVNGQRSKTNSNNARKKFYTKFLKRIDY
jgi:ribosomal protein S13